MQRTRAVPTIVCFAACWVLLCAFGRTSLFRDPGTFWHIVVGNRILESGLPSADWLTFTFQGRPWFATQWLGEIVMALLYRLGGFDALLVGSTALLAIVLAWIFHRDIERGMTQRWAALSTSLVLLTAAGALHVRPLLASVALFMLVVATLSDIESGQRPIASSWSLLPIVALWANIHGAVLGGVATIDVVLSWWLIQWAVRRPSTVRTAREAGLTASVLLGSAMLLCGTPYGAESLRTWVAIVRSPIIARTMQEHGSVVRTAGWEIAPLAFTYLALWLGSREARWRPTAVITIVWLALTAVRIRHAPFFGVAAGVVIPGLMRENGIVDLLKSRGIVIAAGSATTRRFPAAVLALAIAAGILFTALPRGHSARIVTLDASYWPVGLTTALDAARVGLGPAPSILNDMRLGGFLAFDAPGYRIFGDDRCELYGDEFLAAWYSATDDWFARWVHRNDVRVALAEPRSALHGYLQRSTEWRLYATSRPALLYVRE